MEQLLGLNSSDEFDRDALVQRLQLIESLTPMVAANYVKFLPISRLFEPPPEVAVLLGPCVDSHPLLGRDGSERYVPVIGSG